MPQVSASKRGNMVNIASDAVCPVPFRSTQCKARGHDWLRSVAAP